MAKGVERIESTLPDLMQLAQGGTAVGTGLNAPVRAGLMEWLEGRIEAGVAVVMATHYRREWPRNATHELALSRGRVVYAGTVRR